MPGGRWLVVALVAISVCACACASTPEALEPRNPGDRCVETCPEGMRCTGTVYTRAPRRTYPGRCELDPGRCAVTSDCARGEQCVRASDRMGLCAPSPRL